MIIGALIATTIIGAFGVAASLDDCQIAWGQLAAFAMVLIPIFALIGRAFQ